jgi:hypothetical protein
MEAMQANTIDVVKRMKEITQVMKTPEDVLESQGVTPENIEGTVLEHSMLIPKSIHSCYRQEARPSVLNYCYVYMFSNLL